MKPYEFPVCNMLHTVSPSQLAPQCGPEATEGHSSSGVPPIVPLNCRACGKLAEERINGYCYRCYDLLVDHCEGEMNEDMRQ